MPAARRYHIHGYFSYPLEEGERDLAPATDGRTERQQTAQPIVSALLTVDEAACYLSIGRSKLYELLASPGPAIPSLKIGSSRRVRRADLDRYVEQRLAGEGE